MCGSRRRSHYALLFTAAPPLDHQVRPPRVSPALQGGQGVFPRPAAVPAQSSRGSRAHSTVVRSGAGPSPDRAHSSASKGGEGPGHHHSGARLSRTGRISLRTPSASRPSPEAWQTQPRAGTPPQPTGGPLPVRSVLSSDRVH
ncbi:hypothetical protein NDU88_002314 [Pleurodeles waltl]|uniref:Uncharacterized protein n=1 Tax=Pleurodeles waltl TaxID=8319 RepID=A0AAV7TKW5_PLEWA|nr:hypothetical protein NDU88_002314 [Pleurodeles waltl]